MVGDWAATVTFALFGTAAIAIVVLGLVMTIVLHRYPEAYRQAFWQSKLFTLDFLRATTSRVEFAVLMTCFFLVALLFAWVLTAVLVGWLKPLPSGS